MSEPPKGGVTVAAIQERIRELYGSKDAARGDAATFLWLAEEFGELATALRSGSPEELAGEMADVLAWQLGNNGPVSPLGGRAVRQVLDAAGGAAGCDLNQVSRVPAFEGVTAAELARRANVSLPAAGSTR